MPGIHITDRVLFRDTLVIVLNKPTGIPVHAGPNGGENLEEYFTDLKFDYKETPKLAHRLDRDGHELPILQGGGFGDANLLHLQRVVAHEQGGRDDGVGGVVQRQFDDPVAVVSQHGRQAREPAAEVEKPHVLARESHVDLQVGREIRDQQEIP